jgi:hypothetical protein
MSTLETTISMMKQLPERDLLKVQAFVRLFFPETSNPFAPLTEEEIYSQLDISRKHADEGKLRDARQVSSNVRAKYGL